MRVLNQKAWIVSIQASWRIGDKDGTPRRFYSMVCLCKHNLRDVEIRYKSLVPHSGQNLAPLAYAPQLGRTPAGARSILVPLTSAPQFGQASETGCTKGEPHSGQNFVPAAARVPSLGQRAILLWACWAASLAFLTASPNPNAFANPFSTAPACSDCAWAIWSRRGESSLQ